MANSLMKGNIMADNFTIPAGWGNAEILETLTIVDKAELEGIPFIIRSVHFQTSARQVRTVFIDGERVDGTEFTFTDSSTGVKTQISAYLEKIGKGAIVESETEESVTIALVIPQGLRKSEYEVAETNPVTQRPTGKTRVARTYYLTGDRPGTAASKAAVKPAATRGK